MAKKVNLDNDFVETQEVPVLVEDTNLVLAEETGVPPKSSVERTKYILSFLDDSETFEGTPKVGALRRLVEKFVGEIVESNTRFICVDLEHHGAAATHSIKVKTASGEIIGPFDGSGDASVFNNDNAKFVIFPTSLAETRSKGRAYVNALGITVNAAEEFCRGTPLAQVDSEQFGEAKISDAQLSAIETVCRTANVNTNSLLKMYAKQFGRVSVSSMTKSEGLMVLKEANKYQQSEPVPDALKGFQTIKRGN